MMRYKQVQAYYTFCCNWVEGGQCMSTMIIHIAGLKFDNRNSVEGFGVNVILWHH